MFNDYQHTTDRHKKISNLIRCVEREIIFRRNVYPNRIIAGKMTEGSAKYEIACMREILVILHLVERCSFLDQPETQTQRLILENTKPELKV